MFTLAIIQTVLVVIQTVIMMVTLAVSMKRGSGKHRKE